MNSTGSMRSGAWWLLLFVAAVSVVFKVTVAGMGNNFDVESYELVSDSVLDGKIVYAATDRYNYGPVWAYVVSGIRFAQKRLFLNDNMGVFHMQVAALLAYVDVLIAVLLAKRFSAMAGFWFLLNPVSILITGYHSQLDNLAILVGLFAALALFDRAGKRGPGMATPLVVLGLSLATKHILVFFPFWLFFRREFSLKAKMAVLTIPLAVFALGFAPFILNEGSRAGIINNVFGYSMQNMAGFYPRLIGLVMSCRFFDTVFAWVPVLSGFKFVWFVSVVAAGYLLRNVEFRYSLPLYLVSMCVFSPNPADQYLAIPLVACAIFRRSPLVWAYTAMATIYLLTSPDNIACQEPFDAWAPRIAAAGVTYWRPFSMLFAFLVLQIVQEYRKKLHDGNVPAVELQQLECQPNTGTESDDGPTAEDGAGVSG